MRTQTLKIGNPRGLHARLATAFVKKSNSFLSTIEIVKEDKRIDGKSIMGVMVLAAKKGDEITLKVNGSDEIEAINDLTKFLESTRD